MHFPTSAIYHGAFPPEELPDIIEGAFGLVWDGNGTDGCEGAAGKYLRINDPHKLSLYLASGMPVIVWKKAAIARFVKDNKVGFAVENLNEIPNEIMQMTADEYEIIKSNVLEVSARIRKGYYLKTALEEIDEVM